MTENLLLIDFGSSRIKYILRDNGDLSYFNQGSFSSIVALIEKYHSFNKHLDIVSLGANSRKYNLGYQVTFYEELNCIGHLAQYYGCNNALIVNIGTGTSFLSYIDNDYKHLIGTGLGGGTIIGLSHRLLDTENVNIINELSKYGTLEGINTTIQDIGYGNMSWLDSAMTVSNFNKLSSSQSDVASGIISMVIEPILSIVKSLMIGHNYEKVFFSGSVLNFNLLRDLISKYSKIFDINSTIIDKYEYGTLLGALAYHDKLKKKNEL